ncbi:MAG: LytTR family transcriptional regulator [Bacteroidales bacterium]|jgi:hypothetical protein|nr:LytTR family transcriptional regulator [Bacteroidales bacterium]
MEFLNRKIPDYVCRKQNIVGLIIFTAVFALLFINLYKPFNSRNWYPDISASMFFVFSSVLILFGVFIVAISRMVMYFYARKHVLHYWEFGLWNLIEIFAMSSVYAVCTLWASKWTLRWGDVILNATINTLLILLLPYTAALLFESWDDKNRQLKSINARDNSELAPLSAPVAPMVAFFDEKNELRLTIKRGNLLYLESADNYVYICYINKGAVSRFLLRNNLKNLEEQFAGTNVMRCHRSYMVNFDNASIIRRENEGLVVEFPQEGVKNIPVSHSYTEQVTKYFLK